MEDLGVTFWRNKRVLLTGHTGFKGSWLSLWLTQLGAHVTGIALAPDARPALFEQLRLEERVDHHVCDVRDAAAVARIVEQTNPDVVFHLAAQSLVRRSYRAPLITWETNVMGTIHVLEALRWIEQHCAAVFITTDKVYENREQDYFYRETDALGGHDPYSASKAGAELAIAAWRASFVADAPGLRIASARAGNVIGGGDWAEDRLVPDLVRALRACQPLHIRNPDARRPWQHVLDALGGYLRLAQRLYESEDPRYQDAFNFGPLPDATRSVRELVEAALSHWPGRWEPAQQPGPHEAGLLALNIDRARERLGWRPAWDFERSVRETMDWYRTSFEASPEELRARSEQTIDTYLKDATLSAGVTDTVTTHDPRAADRP